MTDDPTKWRVRYDLSHGGVTSVGRTLPVNDTRSDALLVAATLVEVNRELSACGTGTEIRNVHLERGDMRPTMHWTTDPRDNDE